MTDQIDHGLDHPDPKKKPCWYEMLCRICTAQYPSNPGNVLDATEYTAPILLNYPLLIIVLKKAVPLEIAIPFWAKKLSHTISKNFPTSDRYIRYISNSRYIRYIRCIYILTGRYETLCMICPLILQP